MGMKEYDAYLFDWDGTLGQTLALWLQIVRRTLDKYGIEATDKQIVRQVFGNARAGITGLGVPEKDLEHVFKEWDGTAQDAMLTVELYPQAKAVLEQLHARGKKLALITATIRPTVEKALAAHGMKGLFDVTVTGDEVTAHKPDPESLLTALGRLQVPKGRAVMLGDSEKDVRAAHNAGIDSVLFFPPQHKLFHTLEELQADKPTYMIRSWQEFLDQLQ
jgi:HAD superfamily hydrolase (TIGR01509 family)